MFAAGFVSVILGFLLPFSRIAQAGAETFTIDANESVIAFEGASTLHPIHGKADRFTGAFSLSPDDNRKELNGDIRVRIESMKASNRQMTASMHRMFDNGRFPEARCRVTVVLSGNTDAPLPLSGVLEIRDIARPFECMATVRRAGDRIEIKGSMAVSLKEFDLHPPVIMGFIRVQDRVKVDFDVILKPSAPVSGIS